MINLLGDIKMTVLELRELAVEKAEEELPRPAPSGVLRRASDGPEGLTRGPKSSSDGPARTITKGTKPGGKS